MISQFDSWQLKKLHSGKVRESFYVDDNTRLIVVTDRISCFDRILKSPIPGKGAVLNGIANYWFSKTSHIIKNHIIKSIAPAATLVRECTPLRVEMIVRGYLTGSAWRAYETGKRVFSGVVLPDGLTKNQKLKNPIVTPTTKEESDREITPDEIIFTGLATPAQYAQMEQAALELFRFGTQEVDKRKLILVDTKYEFGVVGGEVILIDEIHTPDSSRFWYTSSWIEDSSNPRSLDKEYVREWLLANKTNDKISDDIPAEVVAEASRRYAQIFAEITGNSFDTSKCDADTLRQTLVKENLMKDGYVAIIMGSAADLPHAEKMAHVIRSYNIAVDFRVVSAHKNGERIPDVIAEYNSSYEPGVVIAVAGLSNGLGGALAANLNLPVINCPPFKDMMDLSLNIHSSLLMPSGVPAATVANPDLAAHAALRALNLPRLRKRFDEDRETLKNKLIADDARVSQLARTVLQGSLHNTQR